MDSYESLTKPSVMPSSPTALYILTNHYHSEGDFDSMINKFVDEQLHFSVAQRMVTIFNRRTSALYVIHLSHNIQ
jgi:hypothetical protein